MPAEQDATAPPVRIPPLAREHRDEFAETVLAGLRDSDGVDLNLFATLAYHPRLLKRWSAFGGSLLFRGELTARARELLILRTAHNTGAAYEWAHHVSLARAAGISDAEIGNLRRPVESGGWLGTDEALLRAADELHHDSRISDSTWTQLAAALNPAQLIEVCMLVGNYHLVAYAVNSLGIQPEPHLEGWAEQQAVAGHRGTPP